MNVCRLGSFESTFDFLACGTDSNRGTNSNRKKHYQHPNPLPTLSETSRYDFLVLSAFFHCDCSLTSLSDLVTKQLSALEYHPDVQLSSCCDNFECSVISKEINSILHLFPLHLVTTECNSVPGAMRQIAFHLKTEQKDIDRFCKLFHGRRCRNTCIHDVTIKIG
jgi:hypothetical protein